MGKALRWAVVAMVALGVSACGDDDDDSGGGGGSAASICMDEIACGGPLVLDQASCVQLYEAFLTPAQIAACDTCRKKESCETQQAACESVCTAQ